MSDDKAQPEPSMEDILASIRRILSEDEGGDPAAAPPPPAAPAEEPFKPKPRPVGEMIEMAPPPPKPAIEMVPIAAPPPRPEPEMVPIAARAPKPEPELVEDVLELTDDMMTEEGGGGFRITPRMDEHGADEDSLLAARTQSAGATALSELARAVARERGVMLGNGGITLEDLVREILRTLIKDWLDQNLPYMIERLVKKEIERMVSRAEKL